MLWSPWSPPTHTTRTHPPKTRTYAPVVLHGVVPRVEDAHARDLHHEHGGPQHVARVVAPELDAPVLQTLGSGGGGGLCEWFVWFVCVWEFWGG